MVRCDGGASACWYCAVVAGHVFIVNNDTRCSNKTHYHCTKVYWHPRAETTRRCLCPVAAAPFLLFPCGAFLFPIALLSSFLNWDLLCCLLMWVQISDNRIRMPGADRHLLMRSQFTKPIYPAERFNLQTFYNHF